MAYSAIREHLLSLKAAGIRSLPLSPANATRLRTLLDSPGPTPSLRSPPSASLTVAQPPVAFIATAPITPLPTPMPRTSAISIADIPALALPADIAQADKPTRWAWLRHHVLTHPTVLSHVRPGVQPVFGVGSLDSPIFFCGEAPGAEEEEQGIPFVGRAGQLLTKIIEAMGVTRDQVYIANILNWRPEKDDMTAGNRPPTVAEMSQCIPFLKAQVDIVKPKVIVALGATAVTGLLGADPDRKMGEVRGRFHDFAGTPVMITYHPSYLLRNNTNASKRIVWEDFLLVMQRVGWPISDRQQKFFL